jgi:signal transduction histidine kinase/putative methionine-R-sulfoxide reductase with GAF domain
MTGEAPELDLIEVFNSLSEIPLLFTDKTAALKRITELGRKVMGSHACTLTFVDLGKKYLTQEASAGFDEEFEGFMVGKQIKLGSLGDGSFLDFDLIAKGEVVEKYNLQEDGQGIANPEIARRYNLNSVLSHPLKSDVRLIGYFNHFSSKSDPFTAREKRLLGVFAHQAEVVIDRFEYNRALERSLSILNALSQSLISVSVGDFLEQVSEKVCELLSVPICIVWKLDEQQKKLRIVATAGEVDDEYKKIELDLDTPGIRQYLSHKGAGYLRDVTKPHPHHYGHPEEAKKRGWVSLLSAPMRVEDHLIGMLDVYTKSTRYFKEWEKKFFNAFADQAAVSIQKTELLTARRRVEKLTEIMQEMTETRDVNELLKLFLNGGLDLVGSTRGWISKLDYGTGKLNIVACSGEPPERPSLRLGEGITGKALQDGKPIRAADVRSSQWQGIYRECWKDTRSELAVPILISKAQVRVGRRVELGSKPIGVLNIESPTIGAFSQADEDLLWSLARHAAIMIERLDFDSKLKDLRQIERKIIGERDYDRIVQIVMKGITETLDFEYVNISLVIPELNCIRTEYITGISKYEVDKFKRMANHSLESEDIQADIVRSREIEVPDVEDKRFDPEIYKRFHHERLIRVFAPMISSDNQVIGTVEVGYQRHYRKYVYEQDIQILKGFVDYAVQALEQRKRGLLDKISHEFRAPIVGVRNNASFLQRRIWSLPPELVDSKFNDIITDCEILLYQVGELEHILGRPSPVPKIERTWVYRDIIIKTINQLKPLVDEQRFAISKIHHNPTDSARIIIYVDKAKLNQVVYNLLINSIKYAESDPNKFRIEIEVDETKNDFIIKFKDQGIGIRKGLEEKIFDDGFRAPEAIGKNVTGSGLGLTIARKIMRKLGGDLKLANISKPTEFHMILPKSLKEAPDDTLR